MTVSLDNSKAVYQGIKDAGIRFITALPETWLVYLLQLAEEDPDMQLLEVAKEEEAVGIAAGAHFAGRPHLLLMQNHGFLAAINGIVSLAMLYRVPLCMLIAHRGHMGEPYPWHTQGGIVTEPVLKPIRRIMPDLGGLDLSPVILLLACLFLRWIVIGEWLMPALR